MQRDGIDTGVDLTASQQGRQGGREGKALGGLRVIQRLDAKAITHHMDASAVMLMHHKGKHAMQAVYTSRPPGCPGLEHDLGIPGGKELTTLGNQLFT